VPPRSRYCTPPVNSARVSPFPASPRASRLAARIVRPAAPASGGNVSCTFSRPSSAVNWNGPYATEAQLKDPFNHQFQYKMPGSDGRDYDLVFLGKDGQPGGDGLNKDVGNWQ